MALRAMMVLTLVLSVSSVAAGSTGDCEATGSCSSDTGGLSMLQFRQDSVKAAAETEMLDDNDDDDEDEEEGEEEEEEEDEEKDEDEDDEEGEEEEKEDDDDEDEGEQPTEKPGKGGKGGSKKKEWMKKVVAACAEKEAEEACSYEGKDGESVEGVCSAKKDTLWCKAAKPGKGGKGGSEKKEWIKKLVAACAEKEAEEACSYEGKDGEAVEGTCSAKKDTLWCKAAKPGKGGKGSGKKEELIKKLVAACEGKEAKDACSVEIKEGVAKDGTCVSKKGKVWCKIVGGRGGKGKDEEEKEEEKEDEEEEEMEEDETEADDDEDGEDEEKENGDTDGDDDDEE